MSRLRTRETLISPCVGLVPSPDVCTRKKWNYCRTAVHSSTAVIAHGFWLHIGSIPLATSNRHASQLALRRGASRAARNLFTTLPHRLQPFNHRLAQFAVFGFRNRSAKKKSVHLGRNRLTTCETRVTGSTADVSLLCKGSSDVLDQTCVLCSVDLCYDAGCLRSKTKQKEF